jgi:glycerol-3-phosphate dehydrogenase
VEKLCPFAAQEGLTGGYRFFDAQTDDARLVLRVLQEGVRAGGRALPYARVEGLLRGRDKRVCGIQIRDMLENQTAEAHAAVVINATGAWADDLRAQVGRRPRLRRLRGSHLFFPRAKLPLDRQITFQHPQDRRYILVFPWEGVTLVGNTDIDYRDLMAAVGKAFPGLGLTRRDALSTQTGFRSVLDTGKANPSKESRDEVLWDEEGLVTITGGKLTMFRHMACKTLAFIRRRLPGRPRPAHAARALDAVDSGEFSSLAGAAGLGAQQQVRLLGRHGYSAPDLMRAARAGELTPVGNAPTLWAELRWAARTEEVTHLDDLLLRRTRLGLVLPGGAQSEMERIRSTCQEELGWNDIRWQNEADAYQALWQRAHAPPGG